MDDKENTIDKDSHEDIENLDLDLEFERTSNNLEKDDEKQAETIYTEEPKYISISTVQTSTPEYEELDLPNSLPVNYDSFKKGQSITNWNYQPETSYTVAAGANDAYIKFQDKVPSNYDNNHSIRHLTLFGNNEVNFDTPKGLSNASFLPSDVTSSYGTFNSDAMSEFDVILNDGSKQKRTVSLSSNFDDFTYTSMLKNKKDKTTSLPTVEETPKPVKEEVKWFANYIPDLTLLQKRIIKSVLAYFLGSLLTFIPLFRHLIGTSSHMAAISCFFLNPGQSIGMFLESMAYGIIFVIFGLIVSGLSLYNMAFWNSYNLESVANWSTWIIFIGGASFILGFIKAKYDKPTVNKCIPNAFIFIYIVLVNYTPFVGNTVDPFKIYDLAKTLSSGILINFIICTQIWPRWEADKLRADIVTSLESFKGSLATIVKTFLLEEVKDFKPNQIEELMNKNRNLFLTLKQRFNASYWEFHLELEKYNTMGKVVDRLNRLGQKLGGLSSGVDAQKEILETCGIDVSLDYIKSIKNRLKRFSKHTLFKSKDKKQQLEPDLEIFHNFIRFITPPTKALAFTCKQAIVHLIQVVNKLDKNKDLPAIYHWNSQSRSEPNDENISVEQLKKNIESALELFSKSQSHAMATLYKKTQYDGRPTEEIFLVYFFVFAMEEFAKELLLTINAFEEMSNLTTHTSNFTWFYNFKSQIIALFYIVWNFSKSGIKSIKDIFINNNINDEDNRPLHYPSPQTKYQKIRANFWYFLMSLRDYRILFAIKSSVAAMLVSSPIYIMGYKQLCKDWRVGWTLITLNLVMSPTIGASSIYGIHRFNGTLLGSIIAYSVYSIFGHYFIALTIISSLIAIPCMYIYLATSIPRFGQFTLLSYNLIVLTTYANRHDVEFSFEEYAFIRATSVTLGVLIGLIFSFFILPYEARKELRLGLSQFFLDVSKLYIKLVEIYTKSPDNSSRSSIDFESIQILNEDPHYVLNLYQFLDLELKLQTKLLQLKALLPNTAHEPRLKGPFPTNTYKNMLDSCQILLDKFVAMRIVITRKEWQEKVRQDFIIPLNKHRKDLVGSIILYFHILASTLVLKSPLPPYLPPASEARKRLVLALRELPVVRKKLILNDDSHHIVYYAFIVVLDDIIDQLDDIAINLKQLFGTLNCWTLDQMEYV